MFLMQIKTFRVSIMNKKSHNIQGHPTKAHESGSNLEKAIQLAEAGHYEQALGLLNKGSSASPEYLNARGVCLMRMGRHADAVRVLRSLVIPAGVTWMDSKLPVVFRANFATALFLGGLPQGMKDMLREIDEKDHPSVVRLDKALKDWEKTLSMLQWCGWKLGIAQESPVKIDFLPGEFFDPMTVTSTTPPTAPVVDQPSGQKAA